VVLRQRAVPKHIETREKRRETNEAMQAPRNSVRVGGRWSDCHSRIDRVSRQQERNKKCVGISCARFSTPQFGFSLQAGNYLAIAAQIPAEQKTGCPRLRYDRGPSSIRPFRPSPLIALICCFVVGWFLHYLRTAHRALCTCAARSPNCARVRVRARGLASQLVPRDVRASGHGHPGLWLITNKLRTTPPLPALCVCLLPSASAFCVICRLVYSPWCMSHVTT
jgi:hypothetical protein